MAGQAERGRVAFTSGLDIVEAASVQYGSSGDHTRETQGVLLQLWGQRELDAALLEQGETLLDRAQEAFLSLSEEYVWREFRLAELEQVRARLAEAKESGEAPTAAQPTRVGGNAAAVPGPPPINEVLTTTDDATHRR